MLKSTEYIGKMKKTSKAFQIALTEKKGLIC